MTRPALIDAPPLRRDKRRHDGTRRIGPRGELAAARLGDWTGTRMNAETSQERRTGPRVERLNISPSETKPRRAPWRLLSALARIAGNGAEQDESTFFRIEYGARACPPRYTTARQEQFQAELLGPPPLGL